jgi:hypothetical protein
MARIPVRRYGFTFTDMDDLQIEFWMIRNAKHTADLFPHYRRAHQLLWPDHEHHRWSDLCLRRILENHVTVLMGPKSTAKTFSAACYALTDWWCFPECTTILMSSTGMRELKLRIWGEVTKLFNDARKLWDLPGRILELPAIVLQDDTEGSGRELRNAIIGVPCMIGHRYVGIIHYIGIKNKRFRLIGDEISLMGQSFLEAFTNLDSNPDFKAVMMGNPLDPMDPLGKAAEPECGWGSHPEPEKTTEWRTTFMGGWCVNLVGTDSPNFDFPQDQPPRYPFLLHQAKIDPTLRTYGKNSLQYYSQCKGVQKSGLIGNRVVTRDLCRTHGAHNVAVWMDEQRTKIYPMDLAYGNIGGDRCIGGWIEFGRSGDGTQIIRVNPPELVPVSVRDATPPEDQIAEYVFNRMAELGISPQDGFYDSTGRGSIGAAFARRFGHIIPTPVEFGGRPSRRPVRHDLWIFDETTRIRRLKRCDEEYSKFVTELWFSVRLCIESNQMRELPEDVMQEGCMREWRMVAGNKIEVESKTDTKERMGRSPDLFDWLAVGIEGARQRGFTIQRLGSDPLQPGLHNALEEMGERWQRVERSKRLQFA